MTPKSMTPKSMTPKSMTPKMTPESPRKSRMGPKKSALAQVSASQDEEESSLNESDLVPTNKGNFLYPMYFFCWYQINIQCFECVVVIKKKWKYEKTTTFSVNSLKRNYFEKWQNWEIFNGSQKTMHEFCLWQARYFVFLILFLIFGQFSIWPVSNSMKELKELRQNYEELLLLISLFLTVWPLLTIF